LSAFRTTEGDEINHSVRVRVVAGREGVGGGENVDGKKKNPPFVLRATEGQEMAGRWWFKSGTVI
jgi:hypothetical protein